ncbi:fibronectin type III domain-containing protein 7 isoform X8 [Myotis myotis]|uniref:fibronectin type III domain-containing protein 7 isoform X8 n=1 Tax=Myotis myotis TaxID=51298 RepID=UPI00174AD3E2|nr:fibronectin type III domain-containing protein 7 isoform X8 [Myotis myotis]
MDGGPKKGLALIGFSLLCLKMVASAKTAPEIPTIDQAYSKISNSITVEWATVPGATSYLLTAKDGDTVIETTVANSPGTVSGLKAATLYQITVSSISAAGRSQASPPTQAKTGSWTPSLLRATAGDLDSYTDAAMAPCGSVLLLAAPVLEVSSPSSDSILVQWEAVYMATGFSVSIMQANGLGRIWKENTTNTTLTFTSLDAGTLYTIKAYAWNANGTPGDDSTCNQRTSPRAPADIQVSFDSGALAASVSWAPTEGASNYTALARSDSSQLSCSTASSGCTISSLRCGTEYLISVSASNDAGSSRLASAGTLKTIACAPGRVTIQEDPPGHLSVSWSNVDLGDYYVAFVKSDDGLEVHCNTSLPQCDFPSECGFTYFISVFAYNKAGQSPLGDVFNYTTAPCCPSDINPVLVSSDRVEMVWSPVRGAELYETRAADGFNVVECNDTAPACTLSALECDTKYNITVYSFSEARGSNTSCNSRFITTVNNLNCLSSLQSRNTKHFEGCLLRDPSVLEIPEPGRHLHRDGAGRRGAVSVQQLGPGLCPGRPALRLPVLRHRSGRDAGGTEPAQLQCPPGDSALLSSRPDGDSGHPISGQRELDCWNWGPHLRDCPGVPHWTVSVSHPSKPLPPGMRHMWRQLHGGLKSNQRHRADCRLRLPTLRLYHLLWKYTWNGDL